MRKREGKGERDGVRRRRGEGDEAKENELLQVICIMFCIMASSDDCKWN